MLRTITRFAVGFAFGCGLLAVALLATGCDDDDGYWGPHHRDTVMYGHVTDQLTGDPIEDARVEVDDRSDFTNDDGFYRIDDLRRGDFRVDVSRPGYEPLSRIVDLDDPLEIEDFALRPD